MNSPMTEAKIPFQYYVGFFKARWPMRGYAQARTLVTLWPDVARIRRTAHFKEEDITVMRSHFFVSYRLLVFWTFEQSDRFSRNVVRILLLVATTTWHIPISHNHHEQPDGRRKLPSSSDTNAMQYNPKTGECISAVKGKAVPLQAWSGPEGSRKLRFPHFMTTAQDDGKVVSLTHRPHLPRGNTSGTQFC